MTAKAERRSTHHTILVVDDQEEFLLVTRTLLERKGHRVLTASSGERALALLETNEAHVVLVDYFMPGMSGEELIRQIRKSDPWVQIILQTGYGGDKPAAQMMAELDIQGYHEKTDGPEKLLLWIDVGLKAHRLVTRLRERERLQSELIANMSHELRTPLHIISGYAELLFDGEFGDLPDEAREALGRISGATSHLSELVSDLLRYGRIEANVGDGVTRWVTTEEVAAGIERLAATLLEDRPVSFSIDVHDAPEGFENDPVKLTTILRSLVTNAVKFTESGAIRVAIASSGGKLRFAVSDTGIGISPGHREAVFEPFRQVDGSPTRHHGGIGLGLALARKMARLLGGDIELESTVGRGSTFTLVLPCAEPAAELAHETGEVGAALAGAA